jgi:hypothetical protein
MKTTFFIIYLALVASLQADHHSPAKPKVFEAYFSKVQPGKTHRFREIVRKYWFPTDHDVKRLAIPIELSTGYWDHIVLFYRPDGIDKLNHTDSVSLKWNQSADKRLGASERAKLESEFNSLIIDSNTQLFAIVGSMPELTPVYYNLQGEYRPVYTYFTKFKHGSNESAFEMMDAITRNSDENPIVFRAISGEIDQISIWPVSDDFSRITKGPSDEMKEFLDSPLGSDFFLLVEDLGPQIGSVRWKNWK